MKAEKPFDFAATPGKLPKQVVPTDYPIRILPNIEKLTFTGTETVRQSQSARVERQGNPKSGQRSGVPLRIQTTVDSAIDRLDRQSTVAAVISRYKFGCVCSLSGESSNRIGIMDDSEKPCRRNSSWERSSGRSVNRVRRRKFFCLVKSIACCKSFDP